MQRELLASAGLPCGVCGKGHFQQTDVQGRAFSYRDEPAIVLTFSFLVPACDVCGELRESQAHAESLDALLEVEYTAKRIAATREMVALLVGNGWRQVEIEQVMALSTGYLSKAIRGEKTLATSTLRHLIHLALHPRQSLRDLAPLFPQVRDIELALENRGVFAGA